MTDQNYAQSSSQSTMPLDPALQMFPTYYPYPHNHPSNVSSAPGYPSPSSQGSDTVGTPTDSAQSANPNGKRTLSSVASGSNDPHKKQRTTSNDNTPSPIT